MWVKICANTNVADTLAAVEAGADAVGFVFAPSKRQVSAEQVRTIVKELPSSVETIGVFTSETPDQIMAAVEHSGIRAVQLHGGQVSAASRVLAARMPQVPVIPVVAWQLDQVNAPSLVQTHLANYAKGTRVLLDAKLGATSGGLGIAFDWRAAQPAFAANSHLKLILAGGLDPGNVAEAIALLTPWGVDVASGVERAPGIKDHAKVRKFIAAVKNQRTGTRSV